MVDRQDFEILAGFAGPELVLCGKFFIHIVEHKRPIDNSVFSHALENGREQGQYLKG